MYRRLADSINAVLRSDKLICLSDDVLPNADGLLLTTARLVSSTWFRYKQTQALNLQTWTEWI